MGVDANPSGNRCLIAFHRRHALPYGCVVRGENVSCRTVNCWVWLHEDYGMQSPLQKGNAPDSTFCALADLVRLAGPLPGRA